MDKMLGKHVLVICYGTYSGGSSIKIEEVEGVVVGFSGYFYLVALNTKPKVSRGIKGTDFGITYINNIKDFVGYDCMFCKFEEFLEIWDGE